MDSQNKNINLSDIDDMVDSFLEKNESTLKNLCNKHLGDDGLSFSSFREEIKPMLKNTAVSFVNGKYTADVFTSYLFPTVYTYFRQDKFVIKTTSIFICPACKFLGKETQLTYSKLFKCSECEIGLNTATSAQKIKLFNTFKVHSKKGFKCNDCERFIPQPLDNSRDIFCPYMDCIFVGKAHDLKSMRHPTINTKIKELSLNEPRKSNLSNSSLGFSLGDNLQSNTLPSDEELEIKETLTKNLSLLKETIQSQINSVYYSSSESTLIHKLCMYQAYLNILEKHPSDMVAYLVFLSRHGGLQHRIFQEYISLLESKIPFSFTKNGKFYKINSLLDPELSLFDGISTFDATVSDKNEIKNNTQEFYIGGRSGFYSKPFYIGKLLDVVNLDTKISILTDVEEYSFSKIKLKSVAPGTKVQITHLRVPPHYQMGGMVYLNRIRRKIVDKVYLTLHGSKRIVKGGI